MLSLLSVVVPCHNEAGVLRSLHEEVVRYAAPLAHEIELVLVDDGSRDDTWQITCALRDEDPRVRPMSFSRNFGKEAAIRAGLEASRGEAVVLMDADLQHPPRLFRELVAAYEAGADQVVARRSRTGDPKLRTGLSRAYYRFVNRLIDVDLEDGVGDFRLMSREVVDAVLSLDEANRFSKGLFSWVGFRTVAIDYENVARAGGSSSWTFGTLFNYGLDGVLSFNSKPLRSSIWIGLATVALSVLYVAWLLAEYLRHGVEAPGYLTTILAITFIGGVQLVFLGVIGEYVGRIYYETKRRPHYVLRSREDSATATAPGAERDRV